MTPERIREWARKIDAIPGALNDAEAEVAGIEFGLRQLVNEAYSEVAESVDVAPLTYFGPDPSGVKQLKRLIVEHIRSLKVPEQP